MKIQTQLITSAVILAVILVVCSTTVIVGNQRLQQIAKQENLARSLQQDTNELGFLTNSYLLFHDQSQLTLWQSKIDSISNGLAALEASNQQQQNLVDNMKSNQQRLISVFADIKTSINNNPATSQNLDYIGTAYSRLSVQNQGIIANANQLSLLLQNQSDQIKQINSQLIFILFVVFGLLILANFLLINRRVIKSLSALVAGTKTVGSGNLNHVVSVKGKDEFSELSGAFNQMTSDLKSVTASKKDLENEIVERKRVEESLKESQERFSKAFHGSPVAMTLARFDTGRWIDINDAYTDLVGYSREELLTHASQELKIIEPSELQRLADMVRTKGRLHGEEVVIRRKDGELRTVLYYGESVILNGIVHSIFSIVDITERIQTEEALRRSEARWNAAIESFAEGAIIATEDEQGIYWNPAARAMHGFTRPDEGIEPLEKTPITFQLWTPDGAHMLALDEWPMKRIKRGETVRNLELRIRRPDQGWEKVFSYSGAMVDTAGGERLIFLTCSDLTELRRAEQALKESEEQFRAIAETSLVQISVSRVSDGTILFVNRAYGDAFGYQPDELIGRKGIDLYVNSADRAKLVRSLTEQGFLKDYEVRVKRADGTPFWLSTSVRTVNYAGEPAFLGASIDITERKKAEETLRETRDYLDNLFNYANAPIIVWNPDFEITRFNHAFERLTGRTADEVIGKKLDILFPGDSREESMDFIRKTPVGERWDVVEIPILHRDGTVRVVLWNSAAVYAPDGKAAVATIAQGQDITERKKAEAELKRSNTELEASNKELEAFSYSVSHDLRAPLRSIEGFSSALLEDYADKLGEQGKQYLKYVQESSDLMGHLIDDLLKLSRVTRSEMNYEMVNLSEVAQKILTELQKTEPGHKVELNIAPDIKAYGDRNLLRLALENLLGNAWKFSGKTDSPRIEMGVTMHNGKQAYFIRDNGVGFDMAYADKLFKPFQRLHKASEFAGTGIGLATVQRIIRRHGGEVWAESKVGEGATFYFTLG